MPIGNRIVTRSSSSIKATVQTDTAWTLTFSAVPWIDSLQHGDIHIACSSYAHQVTSGLYVVDPDTRERIEVRDALSWFPDECPPPYGGPCYYYPNRLLSQLNVPFSELLTRSSREIWLSSSNAWGYIGRIIDYDPLYEFVTVRSPQDFGFSMGLGVFGDSVVVFSTFGDWASKKQDSLQFFNRLGEQQSSVALPYRERLSTLAGEHGFWTHTWTRTSSMSSHSIVCVGLDGSERHRFDWSHRFEILPLYESGGTLWIATGDGSVVEADIRASDSAGVAVIRHTTSSHYLRAFLLSDLRIARQHYDVVMSISRLGTIIALDSELQYQQSWISPVLEPTAIAFDGETVWILHHGPRGAYTDATLLTRFTLE